MSYFGRTRFSNSPKYIYQKYNKKIVLGEITRAMNDTIEKAMPDYLLYAIVSLNVDHFIFKY